MSENAKPTEIDVDQLRASRLQWSNRDKHVSITTICSIASVCLTTCSYTQNLQQELNKVARKQCHDMMAQFAECAKANGLMVVFRCRLQNRAMNECLHAWTNKDQLALLQTQREQQMQQMQQMQTHE